MKRIEACSLVYSRLFAIFAGRRKFGLLFAHALATVALLPKIHRASVPMRGKLDVPLAIFQGCLRQHSSRKSMISSAAFRAVPFVGASYMYFCMVWTCCRSFCVSSRGGFFVNRPARAAFSEVRSTPPGVPRAPGTGAFRGRGDPLPGDSGPDRNFQVPSGLPI